ncbi:SlyX family protein [Vibrio sp. HN007]|uniref:SlyX family protein n=1 Tax=Vibrio iocasae TaxID=3098914 RepID=UPI0035D4A59C
MTKIEELELRINDLEIKNSFQEQTIDELNDALSQQQVMISKMQEQMKFMVEKIKGSNRSNLADESEETPPPHY